jgi:hypothetical protein
MIDNIYIKKHNIFIIIMTIYKSSIHFFYKFKLLILCFKFYKIYIITKNQHVQQYLYQKA